MFLQIQQQLGGTLSGFSRGPMGLLGIHNEHKITFQIKDREADKATELRKDSLLDFSPSLKRARTKSEAVKDVSSQSVDEFVKNMLDQELKVFQPDSNPESAPDPQEVQEQKILGSALKTLKILNYIKSNSDFLNHKGIRLLMKDSDSGDSSTEKDLQMATALSSVPEHLFTNHKLDSYICRSMKDPNSLFRGGLSAHLKQIFTNCPFLFPFNTKQLYFKLVSFVSSVDIQRSIYFLRQFINQNSNG